MEFREYIMPLRKWWWLLVAATLLATASSYLATRQQAPIYSTRITVMIGSAMDNPNPNSNEFWMTQQLANTYADIAKRDNIREAVMAELGMNWLPEYTARVVADTQLVELSVVDTDPARAQAVANALVNQLVQLSPTGSGAQDQQRQAFINDQLNELEAKIEETQSEITKKQDELANMFSARQIADAQTQITGLQDKLYTLQANYASLLSNTQQGALNTINIIEPAALPSSPIGPNKAATILMAAAIGLVLAAGAAYLLEYLDDTLKNPDDVKKSLGLTTVGAIPVMEEAESGGELAVMISSQSAATEAYRILRTNLQFASVDRPLRTLMITSPSPSEGKSVTAANLAAALAQSGKKVVLVDTDLHRPRQHRLFKGRNNVGVTSALLEEHPDLETLLQETSIPGLRVLTSGPLPPNPAELLGSVRMRELLLDLTHLADIVVLDSPPAMVLSDAAILSTQADGVLLVLDASKTRREIAKRSVEALTRVNAHLVGALLNRITTRGAGYYYYYYYQYGHYGYYGSNHDGSGSANGHKDNGGLFHRPRRRPAKAQRGSPPSSSVG